MANADLRVAKQTSPDPASAGSDITSTITVTNDGPNAAEGVGGDGRAVRRRRVRRPRRAPAARCAIAGQAVTCSIGSLGRRRDRHGHGDRAQAPPASTITNFTNLATASSSTADPDPTDNTVGSSVGVERASRRVDREDRQQRERVAAGGFVTFTLTARNLGPSVAEEVRVNDTLDPQFGPPAVTGPCEVQGNSINCLGRQPGARGVGHHGRHDPCRRRRSPAGVRHPEPGCRRALGRPDPDADEQRRDGARSTTGGPAADLRVDQGAGGRDGHRWRRGRLRASR